MANLLSDAKKQQVIALGQLGWTLRRIQEATGVWRETAGAYLKAAGLAVRPAGRWGHPLGHRPLGRVVQYTYDAPGHLATVTDHAGGVTTHTYDAQHRLVSITDPQSITFLTNDYDTAGRVVRQTQADGGVFTFAYVLEGPTITATTVTDPRGHATTHRA